MEEQRVFIPVSAEDELPPFPQIVIVLIDGRIPMMAQIRPSENGHEWWTLGMNQAHKIEANKKCVTHWLKDQGGYFFTKDEFKNYLKTLDKKMKP